MLCILCGRICDHNPTGFCCECTDILAHNNQKVALLSLLAEAAEHCPVRLREKIEKVLETVKVPFKVSA
jgi:hypothetical protein